MRDLDVLEIDVLRREFHDSKPGEWVRDNRKKILTVLRMATQAADRFVDMSGDLREAKSEIERLRSRVAQLENERTQVGLLQRRLEARAIEIAAREARFVRDTLRA